MPLKNARFQVTSGTKDPPGETHQSDKSFGFLPGILSRWQNLLLCKLLLFMDQILGGGREVSEGAPLVEESQASDSIM